MVSEKGKRKIIFDDSVYYWYVRIENNSHRIHIISNDKKLHLKYPFIDTQLPVTPQLIKNYLKEYFNVALSKGE
ncbi:MAG: hypothetical protein K2J40_10315 [Ruminococcus sp.]|nr:hypothetical protein [Ruminococcus sp.]